MSSISSSSSSSSSSELPYFCPRCGDEFRFSSVPELRAHLVSQHTYETLLVLSQVIHTVLLLDVFCSTDSTEYCKYWRYSVYCHQIFMSAKLEPEKVLEYLQINPQFFVIQ